MAADLEGNRPVTVNVIIPGWCGQHADDTGRGSLCSRCVAATPSDAPAAAMARLARGRSRDGESGFLGTSWDAELGSGAGGRKKAGAPIGWKALAVLPIRPAF